MSVKRSDEYFIRRFWKFVDQRGECWLWEGSRTSKGYGAFAANLDGVRHCRAHRYCWALHNGLIPDGMMILHTCDNRWCVNPEHLYAGTHEDNERDRMARGRIPRGEDHYKSVLTEHQVRHILESDDSPSEISERLGISTHAVHKVRSGDNWKHLQQQ